MSERSERTIDTSDSEHHIVISADCHAGAELRSYKPYLETKYHEAFDEWADSVEEGHKRLNEMMGGQNVLNVGIDGDPAVDGDRNWSTERRLREQEADGVVGEVLFPNTQPRSRRSRPRCSRRQRWPTMSRARCASSSGRASTACAAGCCSGCPSGVGLRAAVLARVRARIVDTLAELDVFYERMKYAKYGSESIFGAMAVADMPLKPSEYWQRQCAIGASFLRPIEADLRHIVGVDNIAWGNDYPHIESSHPFTREHLRNTFGVVDIAETERMITLNAARLYHFDLDALRPIADRVCPTKREVATSIDYREISEEASKCPGLAPHTQRQPA